MKKKILLAISLVSMLVCLFALSALAVEIDGIYYTLNGSGENATAAVNNENATKCTLENVIIPSTVTYEGTTYTVNKIDAHAFSGSQGSWGKNQTVKTLYVPETVSSIGNHFLRQCSSVQSVTIKAKNANGITLGDAEFYNCTSLASVDMSESDITSFNQYTFHGCASLTTVKLPPRLTKIGSQSFRYCSSLTSMNLLNIPVTEIGQWAFNGCKALCSFKLPKTLVSVGNNCFQGTPVIGTLVFPDTLTTLSNDAIAQIPLYMVVFPDVSSGHSYHSGAFHDVYPTVIIYEGDDYTDLTTAIESFKGYTNALPFSEYDPNTTYTGRAIFYGAKLCDECNGLLEDERFDFTGYENEFFLASKCTNCQKDNVSQKYEAMFKNSGYSVDEQGSGAITIGFKVNNASIAAYERLTGEQVRYGIYAATEKILAESDIIGSDGEFLSGVITAEMPKDKFSLLGIKLFGFNTDEQRNAAFTIGAYVIVEKDEAITVSYVQAEAPADGKKYAYITYNSFFNE